MPPLCGGHKNRISISTIIILFRPLCQLTFYYGQMSSVYRFCMTSEYIRVTTSNIAVTVTVPSRIYMCLFYKFIFWTIIDLGMSFTIPFPTHYLRLGHERLLDRQQYVSAHNKCSHVPSLRRKFILKNSAIHLMHLRINKTYFNL